MSQNTSTAVMQRRSEPSDSLDDFPTPPWATRALVEHVIFPYAYDAEMIAQSLAWDPTCNRGFMARPLMEYFGNVRVSDIAHYGYAGQRGTVDFLSPVAEATIGDDIDWLITNPPFRLAEKFIAKSLRLQLRGFALLMRTSFLEGGGRHDRLFSRWSPTIVAQFSERVVMHKGKIVDPNVPVRTFDKKRGKWMMKKPSSATSYMWFVWLKRAALRPGEAKLVWIPPCREQLERPGDYAPIGGRP